MHRTKPSRTKPSRTKPPRTKLSRGQLLLAAILLLSTASLLNSASALAAANAGVEIRDEGSVLTVDLEELMRTAKPMEMPALQTAKSLTASAGKLVTHDLTNGTTRTEDGVPLADILGSDFVPGGEGSLLRDLDDDGLLEAKNFSNWTIVNDPTYSTNPKHVKLFMTYIDGNGNMLNRVCTGTMIDPMHVITAGHCMYKHDSNVDDWAQSITVVPGYESGSGPWGSAQATQLRSWTGWTQNEDGEHDVGVITLDRPLGSLVGWRGYGYDSSCSAWESGTWRHYSYPAEMPYDGEFMYTHSGNFDSCGGNYRQFDLASFGGASGSGAMDGSIVRGILIQSNRIDTTNDVALTSGKYSNIGGWIATDRPLLADLIPVFVNMDENVMNAGDNINSVSFRIHNYAQTAYVGTANYRIYMSNNNIISSADVLLGTYGVNLNLGPNGTHIVSIPGPIIPANTSSGQKFLGVILDTPDYNTNNNVTGPMDQDTFTVQCPTPFIPPLFDPNDNATCEPTNGVLLHWNAVAGATGYDIQVGTVCGGGTTYQVGAVDTYVLNNLSTGTTYHWRARTRNACGGTSNWATCREFTTVDTPGLATFYGPPDGMQCVNPQGATIDWQDVPGAQAYQIRIATTCGWPTPPVTKAWSDHTYTQLTPSTTYHYQVRAQGACGNYGSWTTCREFTTRALSVDAPSAFYPPEAYTCMGTSPSMTWNAVDDATSYEIQYVVSQAPGADCSTGTIIASPTNVFHLPNQTAGHYTWRVRSLSCELVSPWSGCNTFWVDDQAPSQPAWIMSPTHTVSEWSNDNTVDVRWDPAIDDQCNTQYLVHWDSQPTTIPAQYTYSVQLPETISEPLADGTHYIHMIAADNAGNYVPDVLHLGPFLIDTVPPTNAQFDASVTPGYTNINTIQVSWNGASDNESGVHGYIMAVDNQPNGTPHADDVRFDTSFQLADVADGTYYFHLATVDKAGNASAVDHIGPFIIDTVAPAVGLTGPTSEDRIVQGEEIKISWESNEAIAMVELSYSPNGGDTWYEIATLAEGEFVDNSTTWIAPFLVSQSIMFQIVGSDQAGNASAPYVAGPFYLDVTTGVDDQPATAFTLGGNYPNPFNPMTTIRYSVPNTAEVALSIYDVQGRLVRTLVSEVQEGPANREVVWNGTDDTGRTVASGTYYYQLRAGDFEQTKTMTLLK